VRPFRLYAVTDIRENDPGILQKIDAAYRGGADIVQLRSKFLNDSELCRIGHKIRHLADKYQRMYFVNDRLDIALATRADGIHLGQDDLPVSEARKLMAKADCRMWIGKSTHTLAQAEAVMLEDVDYFGVGPVFATPTKQDYTPVGTGLISQVVNFKRLAVKTGRQDKPFVAIGGINLSNVGEVLGSGAERIAVVRALFDEEDVYARARALCSRIDSGKLQNV